MPTSDLYIPVWPGPVVMVPMVTDILLIGNPDFNSDTTWSSTKNSYYNLWMQLIPDQPAPFGTKDCPAVGAHLMWTLPYSLRQGNQPDKNNPEGAVDFPIVPNRWLITRFSYPAPAPDYLTTDTAPVVTARIVESDHLFDITVQSTALPGDDTNADPSQYPYSEDSSFPVRGIGEHTELDLWDPKAKTGSSFLKAVGPGDISWSVAYDNIKNVFSFHDDLASSAPGYFTYSIIGWYDNPEDDILIKIPVDDNKNWLEALENKYSWSPGDAVSDVQDAIDAWLAWQQAHGLQGVFDPSTINLPEQAKAAIIAWYNWQQANGEISQEPSLPRQTLCHSMASVLWKGDDIAYGTGVPKSNTGEQLYPKIAIGCTSIEAISTYMANRIVEEMHQSPDDIPILERALEAFQKDLLPELEADPVKVETLLHNDRFESSYSGQQWIVVRPESSKDAIAVTGGQQTIPLDSIDTKTLTDLNLLQDQLNTINAYINTQRQELFLLSVKLNYTNRNTPPTILTKLNQSIDAVQTVLTANLLLSGQQSTAIANAVQTFQTTLGAAYVLKAVDLLPGASPNDPVIMVGGTHMDTKLSAQGQYNENQLLFIRFTGQTVTGITVSYTIKGVSETFTIGAAQLLGSVIMPLWNAIPKEAMDIWIETLLLDTSCAPLIAKLYFTMRGVVPGVNDLTQLTNQIRAQQTAVWNSIESLGVHHQALKTVSGMTGVLPSPVAVSFITKQPWTPMYMDWEVIWYPSAAGPGQSLQDWQLGDIDYQWEGSSIEPLPNKLIFEGRTILNARTTQNIQAKFEAFKDLPDYDTLPQYVVSDLGVVASEIGNLDMLTQAMSGFTKQLVTQLISINSYPTDPVMKQLLGDSDANFRPVLTNYTDSEPFFPIRSGHFSVIDLWIVDAYGQVMRGKDPLLGPESPIPNIYWSESLTTSSPHYSGDAAIYGQLAPRLNQPSQVRTQLLQCDDDSIASNSSDLTSPICGWVMPNHLDNSLMIFDAAGMNLGAVLKVQREVTDPHSGTRQQYSIRWDAVPGSNTALGAAPLLPNAHLQSFVNDLLKTGFAGAGAYDDLVSVIDVTLWPMSNFNNQNGNQSVLLGRPLALVRAEVGLSLLGNPVYEQSWVDTGDFYNQNGKYVPVDPPFMSVPFNVRIGDAYLNENGVIGYFEADVYETFYAVYGANGQTHAALQAFSKNSYRRGVDLKALSKKIGAPNAFQTKYVQENHVVSLPSNGTPTKLTLLVDPSGIVPVIPGSLPAYNLALPTGPVSTALSKLKTTFRAGPLLLDPVKIKMPTPAEVQGKWGWMARKDVTTWNPEVAVQPYTPLATLNPAALQLIEGWITLSGSQDDKDH